MSARSVLAVLDPGKYEVIEIGVTPQGEWLSGDSVIGHFERQDYGTLSPVILLPEPRNGELYLVKADHFEPLATIDVAFPLIHGTFGEDGTLQGLLELANLAYVGCGVLASSVGMDKSLFKDVMRANNIPVVDSLLFSRKQLTHDNAGAFGSNTHASLVLVEILHRTKGYLSLTSEEMGYAYRSSALKRQPGEAVILRAFFVVKPGDPALIESTMREFSEHRRASQPTGPSTGSTFKNPPGDFAGRLIEAAGLKGTRIGGVAISELHGNFFINDGTATAQDYYDLIQLVKKTVFEQFSVSLETEIEIIGDWPSR
jgi:hypothetical protein